MTKSDEVRRALRSWRQFMPNIFETAPAGCTFYVGYTPGGNRVIRATCSAGLFEYRGINKWERINEEDLD